MTSGGNGARPPASVLGDDVRIARHGYAKLSERVWETEAQLARLFGCDTPAEDVERELWWLVRQTIAIIHEELRP